MPRPVFRNLTIANPPQVENAALSKWLMQTVLELQRFSKDVSNFLVQDVAVARVSKQKLEDDFQIMSDGLFVEVFSDAAVVSNTTLAFRPGVIGSWLIVHNIGTFSVTVKNNAGTRLGADAVLLGNGTLTVRYDGTNWVKVAQQAN